MQCYAYILAMPAFLCWGGQWVGGGDRMFMHNLCMIIHRKPYGTRLPGLMGA